ncbi:MAG: hypothetical protein IPN34_11705 [Planctomycetes bacterium]|nr:hypothetical protein [Planctomycetota bacterium]
MTMRPITQLGIWAAVSAFASCGYGDHEQTSAWVWRNDPVAKQFQRAFPRAEHGISYFTGEYGTTAFYACHKWPDGWRITLRFELEVDHLRDTARATNQQTLTVEKLGLNTEWSLGPQYQLPEERWQRFLESGGDRTILGIPQ